MADKRKENSSAHYPYKKKEKKTLTYLIKRNWVNKNSIQESFKGNMLNQLDILKCNFKFLFLFNTYYMIKAYSKSWIPIPLYKI